MRNCLILSTVVALSSGFAGDVCALVEEARDVGTSLAQPPGDVNGDGSVNDADLTILLDYYNQTNMQWANGDFNGDGWTDFTDLTILLANYQQGDTPPLAEPTSFLLCWLGIAGLAAIVWRRRRAA